MPLTPHFASFARSLESISHDPQPPAPGIDASLIYSQLNRELCSADLVEQRHELIVCAGGAYHAMPRSLKVSIRPPMDSRPSIVSSANSATGFMVPLFGV